MWIGAVWNNYGGFGRREYAHRASWRISYGIIPNGLDVLHRCNNTLCVNPSHLYLGTQTENIQDALDRNPDAMSHTVSRKLSSEKIRLIRELYKAKIYSQIELARRYSVSDSYIWALVNNQRGDFTIRKSEVN